MGLLTSNAYPCGYYTNSKYGCRCTSQQIQRYRFRISGPLFDPIDIHVEVLADPDKDLMVKTKAEPSSAIWERVSAPPEIQSKQLSRTNIYCNAQTESRHINTPRDIDTRSVKLPETAVDRPGLSARTYNRVLKTARTIADIEASPEIQVHHEKIILYQKALVCKNLENFWETNANRMFRTGKQMIYGLEVAIG